MKIPLFLISFHSYHLIPVNLLLFFSICANVFCVITTIFRVEEAWSNFNTPFS